MDPLSNSSLSTRKAECDVRCIHPLLKRGSRAVELGRCFAPLKFSQCESEQDIVRRLELGVSQN